MTWLGLSDDEPFGIEHLPYGAAEGRSGRRFAAVRIGPSALDLTAATGELAAEQAPLFADGSLDAFLAAGRPAWQLVRALVTEWVTDEAYRPVIERFMVPVADLTMLLAFTVADYADFYASEAHATNVGRIFRPHSDPLTPNWKHLPIGYHGRAGTVVVSGTDVRRPCGQSRAADGSVTFGPSHRLDLEAELACVVGTGSALGSPVSPASFADHVFGVCLLNDWSARDIQAWEYVPLGPFLGKSFATSVSAWITPLDALSAAWTHPPPRDPQPLPYLEETGGSPALAVDLEISLNGELIARPPFASMYWTLPQLLAHLTVNGASLRTGDLIASGTVSGTEPAQWGSLLELSWNGTRLLDLADGTQRSFLDDGDEVVITASARAPRGRIGLGEVRGRIRPAL